MLSVISQAVFVPFGKHFCYAQKQEVIFVFFDRFTALCNAKAEKEITAAINPWKEKMEGLTG